MYMKIEESGENQGRRSLVEQVREQVINEIVVEYVERDSNVHLYEVVNKTIERLQEAGVIKPEALVSPLQTKSELRASDITQSLTAEFIEERTGYELAMAFTDFARNGRVSPDLHEERERIAAEDGEDNVLPSFFTDE